MSNELILNSDNLPSFNLPADVLNKAQEQFQLAANNMPSGMSRISFSGRAFNITRNGTTYEAPSRVLDLVFVAINPSYHYTFYEKAYTGTEGSTGRIVSRYPNESDTFEFTPTAEFASRTYRHRAVVMLADDPEHTLFTVDFGYKSVRGTTNEALGLYNLQSLLARFNDLASVCRANGRPFAPFMVKVQMSFTSESVPVVQFSLFDQMSGAKTVRQAPADVVEACAKAFESGVVTRLLDIAYDSAEAQRQAEAAQQITNTAPAQQWQQTQAQQAPAQQWQQPQAQAQQAPAQQWQQPQAQQAPAQQWQQPQAQQWQQPQAQAQQTQTQQAPMGASADGMPAL